MGWQFKIFGLDRDLVSSRIHGVATKFSDVFDDDLYYDTLALALFAIGAIITVMLVGRYISFLICDVE